MHKKDNLRRFLTELEKRANEYLDKLSANDFHGTVRLVQTANDSTEIHLYSSNGTEITNPSGSQKTVMYISVLFAISDFTQERGMRIILCFLMQRHRHLAIQRKVISITSLIRLTNSA